MPIVAGTRDHGGFGFGDWHAPKNQFTGEPQGCVAINSEDQYFVCVKPIYICKEASVPLTQFPDMNEDTADPSTLFGGQFYTNPDTVDDFLFFSNVMEEFQLQEIIDETDGFMHPLATF